MKKRTFKFPVKFFVISIILLLAVLGITGYIWNALRQSDYFKIKEVIVSQGNAGPFFYLKGKNIFGIDLAKESHSVSEAYPDCKRIEVIRNLPDRVIIKFNRRRAVAQLKLYRPFLVDEDYALVNATGEPQEADLPLIVGLDTKIFGPKAGKKYISKELILALTIIRDLKANKFLKDYKIRRIDVSTLQNASFIVSGSPLQANKVAFPLSNLSEGVEVKMGPDNTRNKIMILAGIFLQTKNDQALIKYVDLRFKEPVIKFQDVKK